MRRILALAAGSVVLATTLSAAPCAPSETTLCLNDSRFEVEVSWRDSGGRTGVGQARSITADTGYFWFFSETNIELVIKVLDARSINQKFWVFFGALSNVEYDITVTDTVTGAVKTYHNPLGQFASVGDTGAFEIVSPAPRHETVEVEGTSTPPASLEAVQKFIDAPVSESTAAFTPCAGPANILSLSQCRFRLEVHWADSRGRTGSGRAVQLTGDTGYFWFFNDANVELMVKVLDARSINGNFWVFFGALTNVEYTLHVSDTVSGAIHSYHNPASTFASVGDTGAFRSGFAISVQPDSAAAVTGMITAENGGSLSVAGADGTVYTLEVPPDAVLSDEEVTMSPVRSVSGLPFAGGLAAGVELQPAGLVLPRGATLSIHTAAPMPLDQETPVAWNGSGQDFFLFPPEPAAGDLRLLIFHLGGYGVARGTDAERETQLGKQPMEDGDLLSHETSPLLREGRAEAAPSGLVRKASDWGTRLKARFNSEYVRILDRMRSASEPTTVLDRSVEIHSWAVRVSRSLGAVDQLWPGRQAEIKERLTDMFGRALDWIHTDCSIETTQIFNLPYITWAIHREGIDLATKIDQTVGCLTFELRFQSTLDVYAGIVTLHWVALAENLKLRSHLDPFGRLRAEGSASIRHTEVGMSTPVQQCTSTNEIGAPSDFKASMEWANLNRDHSHPALKRVGYDHGKPHSKLVLNCPFVPPTEYQDKWSEFYDSLHIADLNGSAEYPYSARGWSLTPQEDPWATLAYTNGTPALTQDTQFKLTHTPE